MTPKETIQTRGAIKAAGVLIRRLDALMKDSRATPQRLAELKSWQESLIANNVEGDADLITRGIAQVEGYLNAEQKAVEAARPRSIADIHAEQAEFYRRAHAQQKRLDKTVTDSGHLSKPK